MATEKTPSSKHGRLREEEAKRAKADDGFRPAPSFTPFEGELPKFASNPAEWQHTQAAKTIVAPDADKPAHKRDWRDDAADKAKFTARGIGAKKPEAKAKPDITQRMDALRAALSDKYPHNDLEVVPDGLKVAVPGGFILIDSAKVAACADNAALRAYIDSMPVQWLR